MPHYIYTAMDAKGRELKGKLEAANEAEAIAAIKKMGMYPSSLQEFTPKSKAKGSGASVSTAAVSAAAVSAVVSASSAEPQEASAGTHISSASSRERSFVPFMGESP